MCAKKQMVKFMCNECGAESLQWLGRCPLCGGWNTMEEIKASKSEYPASVLLSTGTKVKKAVKLSDIEVAGEKRFPTQITEIDRTLGGGIVPGSVILFGGEPGIGKSTLILQICNALALQNIVVLYCSGEESEQQLKIRAERLSVDMQPYFVLSENNLETVIEIISKIKPKFVVIDSIQTVYSVNNDSPMGSPNQIKAVTAILNQLAKTHNITFLIVGHVTKEGNLAGPRMLEHMVDVVLYLEGDRSYQFRVLRTVKNRFGSTAETGLLVMEEKGLREITNPSEYLVRKKEEPVAGSVITPCMEGQRAIMVEIQALSVHSVLNIPRRISVGYDYNRMIVLLAVLEKRTKLPFSTKDVYVNVASGFRVQETAADLATAMAIVSSQWDISIPSHIIALGEISLTGEILPVSHITTRIKEAIKMGNTTFICPLGNKMEIENFFTHSKNHLIKTIFVDKLSEVVQLMEGLRSK